VHSCVVVELGGGVLNNFRPWRGATHNSTGTGARSRSPLDGAQIFLPFHGDPAGWGADRERARLSLGAWLVHGPRPIAYPLTHVAPTPRVQYPSLISRMMISAKATMISAGRRRRRRSGAVKSMGRACGSSLAVECSTAGSEARGCPEPSIPRLVSSSIILPDRSSDQTPAFLPVFAISAAT
jgi:hypothetical protein